MKRRIFLGVTMLLLLVVMLVSSLGFANNQSTFAADEPIPVAASDPTFDSEPVELRTPEGEHIVPPVTTPAATS